MRSLIRNFECLMTVMTVGSTVEPGSEVICTVGDGVREVAGDGGESLSRVLATL